MIVTKSMLNVHRKWRGKWPFTVDEVAVIKLLIGDMSAYAIVHKYNPYALSGILEKDFAPLEAAGIWANDGEYKKSLSPFFEFLDWQSEGV